MRVFKKILVGTGLVLASVLGAVVVCELFLRFAFPKYEQFAAPVRRSPSLGPPPMADGVNDLSLRHRPPPSWWRSASHWP